VRYHRNPLPVPRRVALPKLSYLLRRNKLPTILFKALQRSVARDAQIFMFVPLIRQVEPLVNLLRQCAVRLGLPFELAIDGTSSKDPHRAEKVTSFRSASIRLLVTTTILERGVTIPRSDVFILDADNALFDSAALVQMAGRAGRSADDPFGLVYFGASTWSESQRSCTSQIRKMNQLAAQEGYLL
jgi:late competence protein required for DNA uptake (superfamily II DNA/RNA helicase)